jgi:hypothetical protein
MGYQRKYGALDFRFIVESVALLGRKLARRVLAMPLCDQATIQVVEDALPSAPLNRGEAELILRQGDPLAALKQYVPFWSSSY